MKIDVPVKGGRAVEKGSVSTNVAVCLQNRKQDTTGEGSSSPRGCGNGRQSFYRSTDVGQPIIEALVKISTC